MYSPCSGLHRFCTAFTAGTSGCLIRRISAATASMSTFEIFALATMSLAAASGMMPSAACSSASASSKSNHFCTRLWSLNMPRSSSVLHRCWISASSNTPEAILFPCLIRVAARKLDALEDVQAAHPVEQVHQPAVVDRDIVALHAFRALRHVGHEPRHLPC